MWHIRSAYFYQIFSSVQHFLTYTGPDPAIQIRDQFKLFPDEFISGDHDESYLQDATALTTAQQQIDTLLKSTTVLVEIARRQIDAALQAEKG